MDELNQVISTIITYFQDSSISCKADVANCFSTSKRAESMLSANTPTCNMTMHFELVTTMVSKQQSEMSPVAHRPIDLRFSQH
eukprot:SAG31_NODE_297_length_18175_cov_68.266659_2_plen_83_part_00